MMLTGVVVRLSVYQVRMSECPDIILLLWNYVLCACVLAIILKRS